MTAQRLGQSASALVRPLEVDARRIPEVTDPMPKIELFRPLPADAATAAGTGKRASLHRRIGASDLSRVLSRSTACAVRGRRARDRNGFMTIACGLHVLPHQDTLSIVTIGQSRTSRVLELIISDMHDGGQAPSQVTAQSWCRIAPCSGDRREDASAHGVGLDAPRCDYHRPSRNCATDSPHACQGTRIA